MSSVSWTVPQRDVPVAKTVEIVHLSCSETVLRGRISASYCDGMHAGPKGHVTGDMNFRETRDNASCVGHTR